MSRKRKDPNAPKKGTSSYAFFVRAMRPQIKEQNPDASFGELSNLVAQAWKRRSDEDRLKYEKLAEDDAERYRREMADYSAPSDDSEDEGTSRKRKKASSSKPKRGQTSYMFFAKEERARIKEENPDLSFGDIGKMVGRAWQKLSDAEKTKYNHMAKDDSERYKREMADYSSSDESDDGKKKVKDKNAPKKPKTSYMWFSANIRATVKEQNPDASFSELAKLIGQKWKNISDSEKQKYTSMAKEDSERYKREMKNYTPPSVSKKKPAASKKSKAAQESESSEDESSEEEASSSEEEDSSERSDSDDSDSDSD